MYTEILKQRRGVSGMGVGGRRGKREHFCDWIRAYNTPFRENSTNLSPMSQKLKPRKALAKTPSLLGGEWGEGNREETRVFASGSE